MFSVVSSLLVFGFAAPASDLLPDIIIWQSQLLDNSIDTTTISGHTLLRLSNGTPNIGQGRLELRGGTVISPTEQQVNQRIYRTDGTYWERLAGTFTYHPSHGHIHFDHWTQFRLREIGAGGALGAILATGQKTSFCILDLVVYNNTLPGFTNPGYYSGCGATIQGLTPGWADIYSKGLTDQWIDVTGIPDGDYYLESVVDPDDDILESNEANNSAYVTVHLGTPPPPGPDAYEENDSKAQLDARSEGTNSPQLGLINSLETINNLSIESADPDWFRFRINHAGGSGDYVYITSIYGNSDIDIKLYDASGTQIGISQSNTNTEQISLNGRPAGYYYIQVYPYSGSNPQYTLKIQPSGNLPPDITISQPNSDLWVERSYETVPVQWTTTDPENDPTFVSLYIDRGTSFGKSSLPLGGYQNMPGGNNAANVNTAETGVGKWYLFAQVSDGGLQVTKRANGAFTLYLKGDFDMDGDRDSTDLSVMNRLVHGAPLRLRVPRIVADMDRNGVLNEEDYEALEHIVNGD